MFGMCNPEGVYAHHHAASHHHQSQHYASSADLAVTGGSPVYCGSGGSSAGSSAGNCLPEAGNPHQNYGLAAATAAAAAAAAASSVTSESSPVNSQRSNSVEANTGGGGGSGPPQHQPPTGQTSHSPTGIISDNGLQYANLDGSGYPQPPGSGPGGGGGPATGNGGHYPGPHGMQGYHYSDIHGDGGLSAAAAAAAVASAGAGQPPNAGFSAYLDHSAAYAAQSQYPSIYSSHPHAAAAGLKSRVHDFSPGGYPGADFAASAVTKPAAPAVPTYKWMHVKRNVPKPGEVIFPNFLTWKKIPDKLYLEV